MNKNYVFLLKSEDKRVILDNTCVFIDLGKWQNEKIIEFCGNRWQNTNLQKDLKLDKAKTILTQKELQILNDYAIKKDNNNVDKIENILNKLVNTKENNALYEQVVEEEKEQVYNNEYSASVTKEDIEELFEYCKKSPLYKDILCADTIRDIYEYKEDFINYRYDLNSDYLKLSSGKIVEFMSLRGCINI